MCLFLLRVSYFNFFYQSTVHKVTPFLKLRSTHQKKTRHPGLALLRFGMTGGSKNIPSKHPTSGGKIAWMSSRDTTSFVSTLNFQVHLRFGMYLTQQAIYQSNTKLTSGGKIACFLFRDVICCNR